jgi:hypothetical protein
MTTWDYLRSVHKKQGTAKRPNYFLICFVFLCKKVKKKSKKDSPEARLLFEISSQATRNSPEARVLTYLLNCNLMPKTSIYIASMFHNQFRSIAASSRSLPTPVVAASRSTMSNHFTLVLPLLLLPPTISGRQSLGELVMLVLVHADNISISSEVSHFE